MKILIDCRFVKPDQPDGISRYTAGIAGALSELASVTMLISDERQLANLPDLPWALGSDPTRFQEVWLARTINPLGHDVVFSPMQTTGGPGRRYKLILTLHDLIYYRHRTPPRYFAWPLRLLWRAYHLYAWPQRLVLSRADAVVTGSETARKQILDKGLTRGRLTVVPSGVDVAPTDGPREKILLYMGSFMPYKNVETLIAALRLLPDYTLHLLSGLDPRERERLERSAEGASLVFHDGVTDAQYRELLGRASALVTASRDEGFGIPLIEAMASGTPVVCSDIEVFREVGGEVPLFCDPDSPEDFAAAVRRLEDAGEWRRRAQAGLVQAGSYRWETSAAVLYELATRLVPQAARRTEPVADR